MIKTKSDILYKDKLTFSRYTCHPCPLATARRESLVTLRTALSVSGTYNSRFPPAVTTPTKPLVLNSSTSDRVSLSRCKVMANPASAAFTEKGHTGAWFPPNLPAPTPRGAARSNSCRTRASTADVPCTGPHIGVTRTAKMTCSGGCSNSCAEKDGAQV